MTGHFLLAILILLFFRDSLHLVEEGNVKLAKLIINYIGLTNNTCFSSNTDKRYSYRDTCKNKDLIFFCSNTK